MMSFRRAVEATFAEAPWFDLSCFFGDLLVSDCLHVPFTRRDEMQEHEGGKTMTSFRGRAGRVRPAACMTEVEVAPRMMLKRHRHHSSQMDAADDVVLRRVYRTTLNRGSAFGQQDERKARAHGPQSR